jgi:hypothetical protein
MTYSLAVAQKHFYSWAACRAAQAGSAKARRKELLGALQRSGAIEYLTQKPAPAPTAEQFDALFYNWVERAIAFLKTEHQKEVSFGVLAKLISVYLKGAWVLHSSQNCRLASQIHPPIDSILLQAIDSVKGTKLSKQYKWQNLDRTQYEQLIQSIRSIASNGPLWQIEEHWQP